MTALAMAWPAEANDQWFRWQEPMTEVESKLICLPHAGAGASVFRPWTRALLPEVAIWPVQLPGRENRMLSHARTSLTVLCAELLDALRPHLGEPFALYGHSSGALIAFELIRTLRRRELPLPTRLFLASRRAPQLPSRFPRVHMLPDDDLVEWLHRSEGAYNALLDDPRWRRFYLPTVRADLCVSEDYCYQPGPPLPCPIVVYGGESDPLLTSEELSGWREQTSAGFALHMLPGGHLFYKSEQCAAGAGPSSAQLLRQSIGRYLARRSQEQKGTP
jgi:medium-chain acyl-[acyl-carrier-protein] hydrolase